MGDILGSIFSGGAQAHYDASAARSAMTGYNFLEKDPRFSSYLTNGAGANNQIAALLGLGGNQAAADSAFKNYLGSTGYKFQLGQGQDAIAGSNAAKGLLNSGATGKGLESFGQGLASNYFNNYLGQLSGLSGSGLTAGMATGQAGTTGGGNAAPAIAGEGQAIGNAGSDVFKALFGGGGL